MLSQQIKVNARLKNASSIKDWYLNRLRQEIKRNYFLGENNDRMTILSKHLNMLARVTSVIRRMIELQNERTNH